MRVPVRDMTFAVRSAGERTLAKASSLLRELVARAGGEADAQVSVVNERPFVRAVRRTYEIGLDARRPWVVAIDADVLLLSDAIDRVGCLCAAADNAVFSVTPLALCKFFGGFCFRGVRCHPRRLLDRALRLMDFCDAAASLRPEGAVARAMECQGFRPFAPPVPVGIHAHEQWLRHIYLKMRLRARREVADDAGKTFTPCAAFIESRTHCDVDFLVASWGLEDGRADALAERPANHYDWDAEYPQFADRLRRHGLSEKTAWPADAGDAAERAIASHDYLKDDRTPKWIRERLGFEQGRSHVLEQIGVTETFPLTSGAAAAPSRRPMTAA